MSDANDTRQAAVFGAGSWGTALAMTLARNGVDTVLWGRNADALNQMQQQRQNARYLPAIPFPESLKLAVELESSVRSAKLIIAAVPSKAMRQFLRQIKPLKQAQTPVLWASKGLEVETGDWLHKIAADELGQDCLCGVISGPSFAKETALGLPTAVTVASQHSLVIKTAVAYFHQERFRVYSSHDVIGVELGGALKNVLAIAAGVSDGLKYGANARSALITRGLAEMMRLGDACGAQRSTLMGLTGVGDLLLTCTDDQSRNRRLGLAIGRGQSLQDALAEIGQAVEGANTASVVRLKAQQSGIEMPICEQVYRVLYEGLPPELAVGQLLGRDHKPEAA